MKTEPLSIRSGPFRSRTILLLLASMSIPAHGIAQEPDQVELKGRILIDEPTPITSALTVVELDNQVCVPLELGDDGKFRLAISSGSKAYLRFEEAGYFTKEILVDTENADRCTGKCRKNEKVRFDVRMVPDHADKSLHYRGPVGIITFRKGSGLMQVKYDRTLVRTSEGEIVEAAP